MKAVSRLGLRGRLILALVGVALLAAALTTLFSTVNLQAHVKSAAEVRLARTATHFSEVASVLYRENGGWTPASLGLLRHIAQADGLAVKVVDGAGEVVLSLPPSRSPEEGAVASGAVMDEGGTVGQVEVSQSDGRLLTPVEVSLTHRLNRMHLVAGISSGVVGLAVALYLAWSLSGPLRLIRSGAEAMRRGELDTRVREAGDEEVRAVARALNGLAETLQREEALRKESVADLAHELRTPVMGLLARIEAAEDGVFDDPSANLAGMHDEALRLSRLLDDLTALTDAQRPGLLLERRPVDLASVAERQLDVLDERFARKGIRVGRHLQAVGVNGDEKRLHQVVSNLLSNALRYTDEGGRVTVSTFGDGELGVLRVEDTGIGIAEEDRARVFERFWRGEKSRSRATGGAGIGLAIVRELVVAHGGEVTVTSEPGQGSTFTVTLPLA